MKLLIPGLGVLLIILVIWVISVYNKLVRIKNMVHNSWSQIDVQLKRRFDLVPNLVESVKAYASHENQVFTNIANARAKITNAGDIDQRRDGEGGLSEALRQLFAIAENYPELKANENFMALQNELSDLEAKIAFARQFYNDTVMKYNTKIQTFPTNILAGIFGFTFLGYFEVNSGRERESVSVKF